MAKNHVRCASQSGLVSLASLAAACGGSGKAGGDAAPVNNDFGEPADATPLRSDMALPVDAPSVMNDVAPPADAPSAKNDLLDWTAGLEKGATTITVSDASCIHVGQPLVLDQLNDSRAEAVRASACPF